MRSIRELYGIIENEDGAEKIALWVVSAASQMWGLDLRSPDALNQRRKYVHSCNPEVLCREEGWRQERSWTVTDQLVNSSSETQIRGKMRADPWGCSLKTHPPSHPPPHSCERRKWRQDIFIVLECVSQELLLYPQFLLRQERKPIGCFRPENVVVRIRQTLVPSLTGILGKLTVFKALCVSVSSSA